MTAPAKGAEKKALPQAFPMEEFLDRLMAAELGGRLDAKNPRSTALGPFQFIESTFLFVVNKYFPSEVASLTREQVLALRTDMAFSRRTAGAYSNHLIFALKNEACRRHSQRAPRLSRRPRCGRPLAQGAARSALNEALSADAIAANPSMSGATIANLVRKAAADMSGTEPPAAAAALKREVAAAAAALRDVAAATVASSKGEPTATTPSKPPFQIKCEIGLASCRKWVALQERMARLLVRSAQ